MRISDVMSFYANPTDGNKSKLQRYKDTADTYVLGDLDRDGKNDVMMQSPDGGVWALFNRSDNFTETDCILPDHITDKNWRLIGSGDFGVDGGTNGIYLVFQNKKDNRVAIDRFDGPKTDFSDTIRFFEPIGFTNQKIVGMTDVNGDKKTDLIYRKEDGNLCALLMDGWTIEGEMNLEPNTSNTPEWRIAGAGCFHEHGRNDIVSQKDDGTVKISLYNENKLIREEIIIQPGPISKRWKAVSVGDVNNDGKSDIIWQYRPRKYEPNAYSTLMDGTKVREWYRRIF